MKLKNQFLFNCFLCLLFLKSFLIFAEEGVQIRFVNKIENSLPGQETSLQVYITNQRNSPLFLEGNLNLPTSWKAIPANRILFHLMPKQTIIQTVSFQISDFENEGEFVIAYEVFGKDNANFYAKDEALIIVKESPRNSSSQNTSPFHELKTHLNKNTEVETYSEEAPLGNKDPLFLTVETDSFLLSNPNEPFFISCLIENKSDVTVQETLVLETPPHFFVVPQKKIALELPPNSSTIEFFCLRPLEELNAGKYQLFASLEGNKNSAIPITAEIPRCLNFKIFPQNLSSCYSLNQLISLNLKILNESNTLLPIRLEIKTDPLSPCKFKKKVMQIEAKSECMTTMEIDPRLTNDDDKLFLLLKVYHDETNELLSQNTFNLSFKQLNEETDDLYTKIPAYFSSIATGDNNNPIFGIEFGGGGVIDIEKQRYLEFLFRLPSKNNNVIYGQDQRLYLNIKEPGTDFYVGDTVYNLTPLLQRYRYGRGIGIDLERGQFLAGVHYTQNTFDNSYNPKESTCYLGYNITDRLYLQTSYLNRLLKDEKRSNIFSGSLDFEIANKNNIELEVAKDFIKKVDKKDSSAFRFNFTGQTLNGQTKKETYFELEKIHAGSSFYGYYNDLDTLSGIVDFPVTSNMRGNLSATKLRQNLKHGIKEDSSSYYEDHSSSYDYASLKQRQWQANGNLSYNFLNGASVTLNSILLRAKDKGEGALYDFFQQWGGFTAFCPYRSWNLNTIVAFGNQDDYIGRKSESFLQRYWISISRQITEKLFTNFFYDGGNTNYYDAKPWRNTYGISFAYRYSRSGFAELFLQKVQNRIDQYEMDQMSFNLNHTFSNLHQLEFSTQYFHYKSHYRNDFLFFISYTIPLGLPLHKRRDIGTLYGCVEDKTSSMPVERALIQIAGQECVTDSKGRFLFKNIKSGSQEVKVQNLPKQLITENQAHKKIGIQGGKNNHVLLSVTPTCSIKGEINLWTPKIYLGENEFEEEFNEGMISEENNKTPLASIKIMINRNGGEEIYTTETNSKGYFQFSKLRPGSWLVKIVKESIPFDCEIENVEFLFQMEPKEEIKTIFELKQPTLTILPLEK